MFIKALSLDFMASNTQRLSAAFSLSHHLKERQEKKKKNFIYSLVISGCKGRFKLAAVAYEAVSLIRWTFKR